MALGRGSPTSNYIPPLTVARRPTGRGGRRKCASVGHGVELEGPVDRFGHRNAEWVKPFFEHLADLTRAVDLSEGTIRDMLECGIVAPDHQAVRIERKQATDYFKAITLTRFGE